MRIYRRITQICILIISNCYILSGLKYCPLPILNCYACPIATTACGIGTIQHFITIGNIPFLTIGIFILIGISVGRAVCAWTCPFGLFQELLYKIPIKKVTIPEWLGITKYLILIILVILLPVLTQETWFCKLCPVGAIEGSIPLLIIDESIRKMISWLFHIKILILYTIIYLSIITPRAFCRIFCPAGAIFSLFKYISIFGIHSSKDKCISCGKCKQRCPAGVTPVSIDCIICVECKDDCKHINIGCFLKTTAL